MRRKNYLYFAITALVLAGFLLGCGEEARKKRVVARVNKYVITVADLEEEIRHSPYAEYNAKNLEELLDLALKKEVLIQEAQRRNLDKKKDFMKTIERYWKQTLIKELLQAETERIYATGRSEADQEVMLNNWMEEVYKKADIKVYKDALKRVEVDKE